MYLLVKAVGAKTCLTAKSLMVRNILSGKNFFFLKITFYHLHRTRTSKIQISEYVMNI